MDEIRQDAPPAEQYPSSDELELEVRIAKQDVSSDDLLQAVERIGTRSVFTCPECHGTLWEMKADALRFRCHVGHAYNAHALTVGQSEHIEEALWSAVRALEEKVQLMRKLAERFRQRGTRRLADDYDGQSRELDGRIAALRAFIASLRQPEVPVDEAPVTSS